MVQKFSSFHDTSDQSLKNWHKPYSNLLKRFGPVLDVGCGPGYFLDLLRDSGVTSYGIDIDPEMVSQSCSRGHDVLLGNHKTISTLSIEFGSIHLSHIVEHLWGDDLVDMLTECFLRLRDGGVLVIRTPNWNTPLVRSHLFWMDYTHKRPYPAKLLVKICGDLGFNCIQFGHEPRGMRDDFIVAVKPPIGDLVEKHCVIFKEPFHARLLNWAVHKFRLVRS